MPAPPSPKRRKKRGPGRPPRSDSRNTRQEILTAAEKLFAVHGYHGTSLRQIAKNSHVDLATIKYHYTDKGALYDETFVAGHQRIAERFMPQIGALADIQSREDLEGVLRTLAELSARLVSEDEVFIRMLFYRTLEGIEYSDEIAELYFTDITHKIREALQGPIDRKLIREIDADAFAMLIFVSIPAMSLTAEAYRKLNREAAQNRALSPEGVKMLAKELMSTIVLAQDAPSDSVAALG